MKKSILLVASILLFAITTSKASHIVGGEFSVQWVSGNTYHITLNHYRDCTSSTDFQTPIPVVIYDRVTNAVIDSFCMTLGSRTTLSLGDSVVLPPLFAWNLGYIKRMSRYLIIQKAVILLTAAVAAMQLLQIFKIRDQRAKFGTPKSLILHCITQPLCLALIQEDICVLTKPTFKILPVQTLTEIPLYIHWLLL